MGKYCYICIWSKDETLSLCHYIGCCGITKCKQSQSHEHYLCRSCLENFNEQRKQKEQETELLNS